MLALLFLLAQITSEDLTKVRNPAEPRLSPDGRTLVFRAGPRLMRLPMDGGGRAAEIAGAPAGASNLRWSPDGKRLAFLAGNAVWMFDAAADRFTRLCDYGRSNAYLAHAGNWLAWSPDGAQLAFAGTLEQPAGPADPLVITRVLYKSRTSFSDNRRTHVYVVAASGGAPRAVTSGDSDEHSIAWGAGAEIVFLSNREKDPDANLNYDLYAVNPAGSAIRQLTRTPGVEMSPTISPDGGRIAYVATKRPRTTIDSIAEDAHVWVLPGGEWNAALDRRSFDPAWSGATVMYLAHDRGRTLLYSGTRPLFEADVQVSSYSAAGGVTVAVLSGPSSPPEIYRIYDGRPVKLTDLNAGVAKPVSGPELLRFRSFDGTPLEGWLYLPPGQGRVPLILSVHGGPHGMFGYAFNQRWQVHAARGYATLLVNPRGSAGYGQKFSDGCIGDWGGADYRDLMAGVDYALAKYPRLDRARMVVTGSSYGGYLTNWIVTQTNRFKAAVAVASLSNLISFYGTSMYQDLVHVEFNGHPWEARNFERLWDRSPLKHAARVNTPVLFLHGEQDHDVHITQAEEMYMALRRRGVETVLVRYPRAGHGFMEPRHQADAAQRTLEWFDRFVKR